MSTIDQENAKQIRKPMEVHCGLSAEDPGASLTISNITGQKVGDSSPGTALKATKWDMRKLTDFKEGGFPLTGEAQLLDTSIAASEADGKLGMRSHVGEGMTFYITANKTIAAVTMACTAGDGTVTAKVGETTKTYTLQRITVVPVNSTSVSLTIANTGEGRVEIASIVPGISMEWDSSSLVSCIISLRSDLSIQSPSWQVSDIEISAYWKDDISEAISNMNDDVPIWYYAGYPGDYSNVRRFYLSEAAKMEHNTITLKGEDASSKLEDLTIPIELMNVTAKAGKRDLYNRFVRFVEQAGIKLLSKEPAPAYSGTSTAGNICIWTEQSCREHVQNIMNLTHTGDFFPTLVDAGIPVARWKKPSPKWTIYEEDCGDVSRSVERNIARIESEDEDHGMITTVKKGSKWKVLSKDMKVTAGKPVIKNYAESNDGWFWTYAVTNQKRRNWSRINSLCFTPKATSVQKTVKLKAKYKSGKKKGQHKTKKVWKNLCTIKGKEVSIGTDRKTLVDSGSRPGCTMKTTPIVYGKIYQGGSWIFPLYSNLFARSNETGQFTFKGDPRMQPRDVFYLVPKSISKAVWSTMSATQQAAYVCTLENITITHEAGGTKAEVTYRKGVC